jgi:hypothetical protein
MGRSDPMNSTLEKALRDEGLDDNAIARVEKVLWDGELTIAWDRQRAAARYRVREEAERKARAEANSAKAQPYEGDEACQVRVPTPDGHWSWHQRCKRDAKWIVDGDDGKPLMVCTQHMKNGKRERAGR